MSQKKELPGKAKIAIAVIVGILFLWIAIKPSEDAPDQSQYQGLISIVIEEPAVSSAYVADDVLYVAVKDDGTSRKGYAEYICQLVSAEHPDIDLVKVVDESTLNTELGYKIAKELGRSSCN